jgi:O-antigen/teichoic acid export membrane protein
MPEEPADDWRSTRGLRRRYYFRALWSGAAAKVVNIGVQVVSMSMTVRYLGKERYGVWTTITTIAAWLTLANFGLGQGLTTRLSGLGADEEDGREKARRSICSTLVMSASIATVFLPFCLLAAWLVPWTTIFKLSSPMAIAEARPTVLICVSVIVAMLPLTIGGSVLSGYQRNDLLNVTSAVSSVLSLVLLVTALALRWGMPALALAVMLPQVAAGVAQLLLVRSMGVLTLNARYVDRHEAVRMMQLGVKFLVIQLFGIFIFETGALIIASKFGVAEVTPYGITNRLVMVVVTVFSVIASPLWPAYGDAFGRGDLEWARRVFRKSLRLILGLWLCTAMVLGVGGRLIIHIWVGPAAVPTWTLLWTMLVYALSIGLGFVVAYPLNGAGRLTPQVVAAVVCGTLNIPLAIFLANKLGIAGVVVSQAAVMLLIAVPIQLVAVRRLLRGVDLARPGAASGVSLQNGVEALPGGEAPQSRSQGHPRQQGRGTVE